MEENELITEALLRLDKLSNEIEKMKNMLVSIRSGNPIDEAFDEEVFCEDAKERKQVSALLARMIEHLFKIQFSHTDRYNEDWSREIENKFRAQAQDLLSWYSNNPDKNLINSTNQNLQSIYESAIRLYKIDNKRYGDLEVDISLIESRCPWTLKDLMELSILDLCKKLD